MMSKQSTISMRIEEVHEAEEKDEENKTRRSVDLLPTDDVDDISRYSSNTPAS